MVKLPASELEIMQAIWLLDAEGEKFITASLAMKRCPGLQRLKLTTVITLINRLLIKGQKIGHSNGYIPLISSEEYRKFAYGDFLEKVYLSDKMDLVSALLTTEDFTKQELSEIKALIKKVEKGEK